MDRFCSDASYRWTYRTSRLSSYKSGRRCLMHLGAGNPSNMTWYLNSQSLEMIHSDIVTTDTAELVDQAIATLRNVTPKIQIVITMDHLTLLSEFSEWVGSSWLIGSDLIWYFGDELFIMRLINWLDWWFLVQYFWLRCFREGVWHLPGSPSGLAACVSDERYGTSGSYYSWEGEVRVGWVFGEKFKFLKSWKLMIFYVFFHLYVPQWILGCKYQLRMYRFIWFLLEWSS